MGNGRKKENKEDRAEKIKLFHGVRFSFHEEMKEEDLERVTPAGSLLAWKRRNERK